MGEIQTKEKSDLIRVNGCFEEQWLYVHIRPDGAACGRGRAAGDQGLILRISLDIITPRAYNAPNRLKPSHLYIHQKVLYCRVETSAPRNESEGDFQQSAERVRVRTRPWLLPRRQNI